MYTRVARPGLLLLAAAILSSCGETAQLPVRAGMGPTPQLPEPDRSFIPMVNIAEARGWSGDATPKGATGLRVTAFARDLRHPRWLHVLPNGDVLVAETNAPERPDDSPGIKGWIFKKYQSQAGAAAPTANRLTLLRDADGDGVAETRSVFKAGLNSPFGMALVGQTLYIANTDAVVRLPYAEGATRSDAEPVNVVDLPAGRINHHWTKGLVASADGSRLYVSVGSNSNVGERGLDKERERAAVWEIDPATGNHRVYAAGLRNPVGMAWVPGTGALWVVVNERDELGSDLVPDYMTALVEGGFYGFPYSYFGQHVDDRVEPQRPDSVALAIVPDYALGPHTGSLGLAYADSTALPAPFNTGMFVGQHGSWNRHPHSGYKVIFVPFNNGRPAGEAIDVLTGFLDDEGRARGRPVGVAIDTSGALLVADDVGNIIWRVTARQPMP